jgi:hypothetical protein
MRRDISRGRVENYHRSIIISRDVTGEQVPQKSRKNSSKIQAYARELERQFERQLAPPPSI